MTRALLDTTALLAHYLSEPGGNQVQQVLEEKDAEIFICAVSLTEFSRRLVALGEEPAVARERALDYAGLCELVVPVDSGLAIRAFELTTDIPSRIPLVDALIAAAAGLTNALLMHRDAHFRAITAVPQIEIE